MLDSLTTPLEPFFQQPFFQWLLHTSWQAAVLVCLILLVQRAWGRWLGARGSYCLWLVLLIRLVLPAAPPSRMSVYNLLPPPRAVSYGLAATVPAGDVGSPRAATDGTVATRGQGEAGLAANGPQETRAAPGLWEARFDADYAQRDQIVYFYSVAACTYLTWDTAGNVAVNGREPNETARWCVLAYTSGARISPYPFAHVYLRPAEQGAVRAIYGTCPSLGWDIDALWRVKTSSEPTGSVEWHRQHIPGPDWGPPWSTLRRAP